MSGPPVEITVDGRSVRARPGELLAAALLNAGVVAFRASVLGAPRGPLCGMGVCFECRVTVDGAPHQRACMIQCERGMRVETSGVR